MELYQSFSIKEYDYWEAKNAPMFSLFVEKFETKSQELDSKASELMLGVLPKPEGEYLLVRFDFLISIESKVSQIEQRPPRKLAPLKP